MFLTPDELRELTGRPRKREIRRWLDTHHYPHEVGDDGWPKVLRSFVQAKLGGSSHFTEKKEPRLRLAPTN